MFQKFSSTYYDSFYDIKYIYYYESKAITLNLFYTDNKYKKYFENKELLEKLNKNSASKVEKRIKSSYIEFNNKNELKETIYNFSNYYNIDLNFKHYETQYNYDRYSIVRNNIYNYDINEYKWTAFLNDETTQKFIKSLKENYIEIEVVKGHKRKYTGNEYCHLKTYHLHLTLEGYKLLNDNKETFDIINKYYFPKSFKIYYFSEKPQSEDWGWIA